MRATIIDASNLVLGRMASRVAKMLLDGKRVIIVNAEECVISGKGSSAFMRAKEFIEVGSPRFGPHHPRRPDHILRRSIRGMLPYSKPKGKSAYRRLRVYISVPEEFKGKPMETIEEASVTRLTGPYFKLKDLARAIG